MTIAVVAFLMGVFGYRRERWWIPAVTAAAFAVVNIFFFYTGVASWRGQAGLPVPTFSDVVLNALTLSLPITSPYFMPPTASAAAWRVGARVTREPPQRKRATLVLSGTQGRPPTPPIRSVPWGADPTLAPMAQHAIRTNPWLRCFGMN
jgi:hypothetical protein